MPIEILMPALSPTMTEGTVQSWTVEIGDSFSAGDIICQIETDKAAVDFEATDDGFMAKHLVEPGHAPIATGSPIAVTVMEEEDIEAFANAQSSDFVSSAAGVEDAPAPKTAFLICVDIRRPRGTGVVACWSTRDLCSTRELERIC